VATPPLALHKRTDLDCLEEHQWRKETVSHGKFRDKVHFHTLEFETLLFRNYRPPPSPFHLTLGRYDDQAMVFMPLESVVFTWEDPLPPPRLLEGMYQPFPCIREVPVSCLVD